MKTFSILFILFFTPVAQAAPKTICGEGDNRVLSFKKEVGRIFNTKQRRRKKVCTATMISENCAITAGHCRKYFRYVEFNTPESEGSRVRHSNPIDIYEVDSKSIEYKLGEIGHDWAVFKLKPNKISKRLPGQIQGFLKVSTNFQMTSNKQVKMYGHGISVVRDRNYTQQISLGELVQIQGSIIFHTMDSMGGNSGSSIIASETQEIIGIHTHGGCKTDGANQGTYISASPELKAAIKACLKSN